MRLFVAAEIPEASRRALAEVGARLADRGVPLRKVRPETIHMTLRFLGETDPEALPRLEESLREACRDAGPLELRLSGLGVFPPRGAPRVVWAGLSGETEALSALAREVERAVVAAGWAPEDRPFRPHVTVGRLGGDGRRRGGRRGRGAPDGKSAAPRGPGGAPIAALLEDPDMRSGLEEALEAGFTVRDVVLFESRLLPGGAQHTPLGRYPLGAEETG